jgi:hypothetical protein
MATTVVVGAYLEPARLGSGQEAVDDIVKIADVSLLRGLLHACLNRGAVRVNGSKQATSEVIHM